MPRLYPRLVAGVAFCLLAACAEPWSPTPLVTGRALTPPGTGTTTQNLTSLPVSMILSPDGRYVLTSEVGYSQAVWCTRLSDGRAASHVDFPRNQQPPGGGFALSGAPAAPAGSNGLYFGLAISDDNTLFAAQGAHDSIAVLRLGDDGSLALRGSFRTRRTDFPAGLALDQHQHLYVTNQRADAPNPVDAAGSLTIYDTATGLELGRYVFANSFYGTTNYPLATAVLRSGAKVYVGSERDNAVYILDTHDPTHPALAGALSTGAHPIALLLNRNQSRLYVANADSDTVSIVDTAGDRILDTLLLRPAAARDLPGCTPTGLALSPDQRTLYVTLADMNALAVIDLPTLTVRGYVPAGWYPTAVVASPDGKDLLVANGKGIRPRTPTVAYDPVTGKPSRAAVPLALLIGDVQRLPVPSHAQLEKLTRRVLVNNRLDLLARTPSNPLAALDIKSGKITHVIYVVKENRTYDQVLGDLPEGNGDPRLVLFGREVTPNQHALAQRFALLDNLYACGEVSGDGWCWSTEAMEDEYTARNVPYQYSHRGRTFDYEGSNNGYPTGGYPAAAASDADAKARDAHAGSNSAKPIPDVDEPPGGHIWDLCARHGITFRNYGFFTAMADGGLGATIGPGNYPAARGLQPGGRDLGGLSDIDFRRFDLTYPDSDAPRLWFAKTGDKACLFPKTAYGQSQSPSRFAEWDREFKLMLARTPDGSSVPNVMFVRLPLDHTSGAAPGQHTPQSDVADNDFGVGELVEAVSHSPIWAHTAIFVIEDDAQDGPDHVDCHRTTGYVFSPYIKPHAVDHRFYNTNSFLRTIELLLDLPPMTQYDATASPILDWDDRPRNLAPYVAVLPAKAIIADRSPRLSDLPPHDPRREMTKRSMKMDFVHADAAPAAELNEIIWRTVKGPGATMPPSRGLGVGAALRADDDD